MQTIKGKPLSQVVLNTPLKDSILKDITTWRDSKDEYNRRGIAHKRGHCYFGPPGTGKTTLARAIAIEYEMDVYNVNLNNIDGDDDMLSMFAEVNPNSILLFEDMDAYFDMREKVNKDSKITFSGLLNALDGAISLNNVLIIITTNHIEKLDPALLRPGRIDIIKELGFAKTAEAEEYLSMFYLKDIKLDFDIET
jgi:chaperone BCS1